MKLGETMTMIQAKFAPGFMNAYAKTVINNPLIGIREVIINSWDAGATNVFVTFPDPFRENGLIEVVDDGTGMSREEFETIWPVASYNRVQAQGNTITMPNGTVRITFGKNGIGRFGMFSFSNEYMVETWRDEEFNSFKVEIQTNCGESPYNIKHIRSDIKEGHGTRIWCEWNKSNSFLFDYTKISSDLKNTLLNITDFNLYINKTKVEFPVLNSPFNDDEILECGETINITRCDIREIGINKTGVMIRVNGRTVGDISWNGINHKFNLKKDDIRHYLIIVDADFLSDYVLPDWTGFEKTESFESIHKQIMSAVEVSISDILKKMKEDRRNQAYLKNLPALKDVMPSKREIINDFVEAVIDECPSADGTVLSKIVELLANMEKSRSKYNLVSILADAGPDNIDALNEILTKWTISETKVVFDVINDRIQTVEDMRKIVDKLETLEVSQLQPIFEHNLWMFGPEFDSCSYTSNQTLTTVLTKLSVNGDKIIIDARRPDFVITPDSSIATYSADSYDYGSSLGDVRGYASIVIVELKKGGSHITTDEMSQALKYAQTIKKSGRISGNPKYMCYVLGSKVDSDLSKPDNNIGGIGIQCIPYQVLLNAAEARLFGLIKKMKQLGLEQNYNDTISKLIDSNPSLSDFRDTGDVLVDSDETKIENDKE